MKEIIIPIVILLFILIGCDNSVDPTPPKTSGEITINTLIENNKSFGFSFSQGGIIDFPNTNNIIPDIIILVQMDAIGNILGVFFSSGVALKPSFNLIKQTSDIDSAQAFFNYLDEVPDTNYMDLAIPVKEYQIWAVKTIENKFGKILILHTYAYADSSNPSSPNFYGEARFKWMYQPDGSRVLN